MLLKQQVRVGETAGAVNPGTFTVSGSVDAAQQYRLLAKPGSAEIAVVGGPAPFTCAHGHVDGRSQRRARGRGGASGGVSRSVPYAAAIPGGGGMPEQGGAPTGTISCAVPAGVEVFAGLGATMTVTAGQATDVVTVPLTSVRGSVKEGSVWLAPAGTFPDSGTGAPAGPQAGPQGGEPEERKVQLGLNDGSMVEIVSGLAEGEAVLEFIPGAPAQPQPGPAVRRASAYRRRLTVEELVSLAGVTRTVRLPDDQELHILRGVDLAVHSGDHTAVIGRSGCGKSTLLEPARAAGPAHQR